MLISSFSERLSSVDFFVCMRELVNSFMGRSLFSR